MKLPEFIQTNRLEAMHVPGDMGIYIHVPFCVRRCRYCAFVSSVRRPVPDTEYARDICIQLDMQKPSNAHVTTLYFGGGTPTSLGDPAIAQIIETIANSQGMPDEVTLEANPEHVTAERACNWKASGITRISLGIQAFDDDLLHWLGRGHDRKMAIEAVETLAKSGFDEISVDLIYGGNPGEDDAQGLMRWKSALSLVRTLPVVHLSCYELTLEENTPLWTAQKRGQIEQYSEDAILEMMDCIEHTSGMTQYEISNYCRDGYISRHNVSCWAGLPYLGLGAAAHSLILSENAIERRANLSNVRAWMAAFHAENVELPLDFSETLDPQTHLAECLMLAARTRFEWSPEAIAKRLNTSAEPLNDGLSHAVRDGLLECTPGLYRTTPKGIKLNNRLDALFFDQSNA